MVSGCAPIPQGAQPLGMCLGLSCPSFCSKSSNKEGAGGWGQEGGSNIGSGRELSQLRCQDWEEGCDGKEPCTYHPAQGLWVAQIQGVSFALHVA